MDGIAQFILNGGDILNPVPGCSKTLLSLMIWSSANCFNNNRKKNKIILYLIEKEAEIRSTTNDLSLNGVNGNSWNNYLWVKHLWHAMYNLLSEEIVLKLIRTGSTINVEFRISGSLIWFAISLNYSSNVISAMLKHYYGDDTFSIDLLLKTAVDRVRGLDIIKLLLEAGANVQTILHHKKLFHNIDCVNCDGYSCKNRRFIDWFLKNGLDLQLLDDESNTVLHIVNCGYLIHLAVKKGVSIEQKNSEHFSPLMIALLEVNIHKVILLLQLGANPNYILYVWVWLNFLSVYGYGSDLETYFPRNYYRRFIWRNISELLNLISNNCEENLIDLLLYHGASMRYGNRYTFTQLYRRQISVSSDVKKIVSYIIFFDNTNRCIPKKKSFQKECMNEIYKMKNIFLNCDLTLYNFCRLKKYYKSKCINMSIGKLDINKTKMIESFPIYGNFINIRIKDNTYKRWIRVLAKSLQKVIIMPINIHDDTMLDNVLNYDCLYYISKFLNSKDLYKLFLASILN